MRDKRNLRCSYRKCKLAGGQISPQKKLQIKTKLDTARDVLKYS